MPDCRSNDLELFCFQEQLREQLLRVYRTVVKSVGENGISTDRGRWVREQLNLQSGGPFSPAENYVCNYYTHILKTCDELTR